MERKIQRLLSLALAVFMVVGMLPTAAFAEELEETPATEPVVVETIPEVIEPAPEPVTEPEPVPETPAEPDPIPEAPVEEPSEEPEVPAEPETPVESEPAEEPEAPAEDADVSEEGDEDSAEEPAEDEDDPDADEDEDEEDPDADEDEDEEDPDADEDEEKTEEETPLIAEGTTLTFDAPSGSGEGDYYGSPEDQTLNAFYGHGGDIYYSTENMASRLNSFERMLYDAAKEAALAIAAGTRTNTVVSLPLSVTNLAGLRFTAAELGVDYIIDDAGNWNDAAMEAMDAMVDCDARKVFNAVRADCPYEMFWADSLYSWTSFGYTATKSNGVWKIGFKDTASYDFIMYANANYRADSNTQVDTTKTARVSSAIANARSIVNQNSGLDDMSKMRAYVAEIARLNTYNDAAAAGGIAYGDPWQLVYVFDGDPSTNVVCEGYSRAFQYLCEMSSFNKSIWVYPVTGLLGREAGKGGPHMWNIVHVPGTGNLLVDATNCDSGFSLCLVKPTGSVATSYYADGLYFTYDEATRAIYTEDELSFGAEPSGPSTSGQCGENATWSFADGVLTISGTGAMADYPLRLEGNAMVNDLPWQEYQSQIASAVVEEGITSIGSYAFYCMVNMTSVSLPSTLTSIGSGAFFSAGITAVDIPDSVTFLGDACFAHTPLISVEVPAGVTKLLDGCFGDTLLTTVTLHEGLQELTGNVFGRSRALKEITIPASVTVVGINTFYDCPTLESVTFLGNAPTFHETAFGNTTATIYYDPACTGWDAVAGSDLGGTLTWVPLVGFSITAQPQNQSIIVGESANFTVEAAGEGLTYQWQFKTPTGDWANCSSATVGYRSATLKPVGTAGRNGYQYRCVIKDADGHSLTSDPATLTVTAALAITAHPANQSIAVGETASFTITATGSGLTYQWQYKTPTGDWTNCSSATAGYRSATLKPVGTTGRNGYQYRCVIKDSNGNTLTSNAATLTVTVALTISSQPANQSVAVGSSASFTVAANGSGLTYQWQYKTPTGDWANCSSATAGYRSATLKPVGTIGRNGYQYRCVIKDSTGNTVTSNAATLTISNFAISTQPVSQAILVGESAAFTVAAEGSDLTYQWQFKTPTGDWANCSSATAGYRSATLKPVGTVGRNGYQYRCVIKDASGNTVTSEAATLTVSAFAISTQPANQSIMVGESAVFTVAAAGSCLTYQWQYKTPTGNWANCSSATVGYRSDTLKPVGTVGRNGYQYRCVIKDASGNTATSNAATLTVAAFVISTQPANQSIMVGESASFTVAAAGTGLTYQWQYKTPTGNWANCSSATVGYRSDTLKPVGTVGRNGYQYRCVIKDASGNSVTSNAATLTVDPASTTFNGVIYKMKDATTAMVIGYTGSDAEVSVLDTVNGRTVDEIGASAFAGNQTMTSISLPNSITVIRASAFANCTNLATMTTF